MQARARKGKESDSSSDKREKKGRGLECLIQVRKLTRASKTSQITYGPIDKRERSGKEIELIST